MHKVSANDKVNLSDNAIKVYESITKKPKITRADLAKTINKSEATVNRAIRELKDNNLLKEKILIRMVLG